MKKSKRIQEINPNRGKDMNLDYLNSPCSISEAVQIARGVAQDVVTDYQNHTGHLQVALSLQVELIKEVLIESGIISEEKFREKYIEQAEAFNRMQQENYSKVSSEEDSPKMEVKVNDVEMRSEIKES